MCFVEDLQFGKNDLKFPEREYHNNNEKYNCECAKIYAF